MTHTGTHIYPSIKRLPHASDWTIKSKVSFLPVSAFSSRTPLNQPKQFISLVRCKYWCLFFCYLSRNTSVEIHCNIRSSKGVLSYTAAINEHEECKDFEFNFGNFDFDDEEYSDERLKEINTKLHEFELYFYEWF